MRRWRVAGIVVALAVAGVVGVGAGSASAAVSTAWATKAGGTTDDDGYNVSTLADGSAILTGSFSGSATFGSTTLTSAGSYDVFIAKVDASGAFVWATKAGSTSADLSQSVSTLADGSAILTGYFQGSAAFGSTTLTSAGGSDVFVAKVDASGAFVWATRAGGTTYDFGYSVSTLADGSTILTGYFEGSATFGSTTLTSAGLEDVFVAKVDASGAFVWATRAGGRSSDLSQSVSTLADGSAILTGYFADSATFGSNTLTSAGGGEVFVAKVNASGAFVWATSAGGTGGDFGRSVSTLADGSTIITGDFWGSATFGSTTLTSAASNRNVFVAKVDASGAFVWATRAGGTENTDTGSSVSTLADGSAILTGYFAGSATFGSTTLTSAGNEDVFVAKVSASGAFVWARSAGGTGYDASRSVSTLADGSAILTGYFAGSATFGSTTLTSAGSSDVFVAKVASEPNAPTAITATAGDGQATISWTAPSMDGGAAITTYTVTGSPNGSCTTTAPTTTCTITGLTSGTAYTFTVKATNSAGDGPASIASSPVTPVAPVDTPTTPPPDSDSTSPITTPTEDSTVTLNGVTLRLSTIKYKRGKTKTRWLVRMTTTNTTQQTKRIRACLTRPRGWNHVHPKGKPRTRTVCYRLTLKPGKSKRRTLHITARNSTKQRTTIAKLKIGTTTKTARLKTRTTRTLTTTR